MHNRQKRIKVSALAGGSPAAADGRRRRKRKRKQTARSRNGYWYGSLKGVVAEDREKRGEPKAIYA